MGEMNICCYCGKLITEEDSTVDVRDLWVAHMWCAADREYEDTRDREME